MTGNSILVWYWYQSKITKDREKLMGLGRCIINKFTTLRCYGGCTEKHTREFILKFCYCQIAGMQSSDEVMTPRIPRI